MFLFLFLGPECSSPNSFPNSEDQNQPLLNLTCPKNKISINFIVFNKQSLQATSYQKVHQIHQITKKKYKTYLLCFKIYLICKDKAMNKFMNNKF